MARTDTDFRGYRARFGKAGKVLKETTAEHRCPECDDGTRGLYTRVWTESDVKDRALFHIEGTCPRGHDVNRYGYGEVPS
jgi:hypothetical protein